MRESNNFQTRTEKTDPRRSAWSFVSFDDCKKGETSAKTGCTPAMVVRCPGGNFVIGLAGEGIEDWERRVIDFCQSDDFSVQGLKEHFLSPRPNWPLKS